MTRFRSSSETEGLRGSGRDDAASEDPRTSQGFPDPFVLLSDTPFRFILLIVAVVSASLFAFQLLFLTAHSAEFSRTVLACNQRFGASGAPDTDVAGRASAVHAESLCRQSFERSEARWMLFGVGALLVVSILLMIAAPWWRTRRGGFYPVDARDDPDLARELESLRARAGGPDVTFMLDPFDPRTSAVAYGRPWQRRVLLRAGLVTKLHSEPETFRAVVLHELAHIRNGDLDQAYLSICTCTAFFLIAVAPFAVVLGGSLPLLPILWRLTCLTALVYLLLLGLLRSRERYADARAAQWGAAPALAQALDAAPTPTGTHLRRLVSLHPLPSDRGQALRDPRALFRLTAFDGLAVGLVAALAAPQATFLMNLISTSPLSSIIWGSIPFVVLAAGFLVTGIWRQQYYEALRHQAGRTWPLTTGFAVGLALGPTIAFAEIGSLLRPEGVNGVAWHLSWTVLVCLVTVPLASWMVEGARSACSDRPSYLGLDRRRALRLGNAVSVLLGAVILDGLFYQVDLLRDLSATAPSGATFTDAVTGPFTMARVLWSPTSWGTPTHVLVLLCIPLLPLVGWLCARPPERGLLRVSVPAVVVAGLGVAGFIAATTLLALQRPLASRWPVAFGLVLQLRWNAAAVMACVLAGIVGAYLGRRRPLAAAGVAALGAGAAGSLILIALRPLWSCLPSLSAVPVTNGQCPRFSTAAYVRQVLCYVLAGGLAWMALVVPVIVALATWYGRQRILGGQWLSSRTRVVGSVIAVVVSVVVGLVGAVHSVDAAERSSSRVQGSIGQNGRVHGSGYSVLLRPGWLVTASQQPASAGKLALDLLIDDTDGSGRLVVYQVNDPLVALAAGQPQLQPSEVGRIDGERAIEIVTPGRPGQLERQLLVDHQGTGFAIQLWSSPEGRQSDGSHFQWMIDHWSWT